MSIKKIFLAIVCSFTLSFCLFPEVTLAANTSNSVPEMPLTEGTTNLVSETEFALNSAHPVCNHDDPTKTLHSSMRFLFTIYYYNAIDSRTDVRDWYQCTLCGYETFFVHGHID